MLLEDLFVLLSPEGSGPHCGAGQTSKCTMGRSWGGLLGNDLRQVSSGFDRMRRSLSSPSAMKQPGKSAHNLRRAGFEVPRWEDLVQGLRPEVPPMVVTSTSPSMVGSISLPSLSEAERAMLRSQGDSLAACTFICVPTSRLVRMIPSHSESCCCDDVAVSKISLATIRLHALCWGFSEARGAVFDSGAARVCREAGARVSRSFPRQRRLGVVAGTAR